MRFRPKLESCWRQSKRARRGTTDRGASEFIRWERIDMSLTSTTEPRQAPPEIEPDNIPIELRERHQWVAWRSVPRKGKLPDKQPINPHDGELAKVNDSKTWGTFQQAVD